MSVRSQIYAFTAVLAFAVGPLATPAVAVEGDADRGEELYAVCAGCHDLKENKIGPKHCGVVDRPAASVPDFTYSSAMEESGIVWTDEELHAFLTSPFTYVSGTMMGFVGMYDEQERADVIAYMRKFSADPELCGEAQ